MMDALFSFLIFTLIYLFKLSKYAMTVAHKVSAAREPIGIIERRQQLRLRDFREDFNTFEY